MSSGADVILAAKVGALERLADAGINAFGFEAATLPDAPPCATVSTMGGTVKRQEAAASQYGIGEFGLVVRYYVDLSGPVDAEALMIAGIGLLYDAFGGDPTLGSRVVTSRLEDGNISPVATRTSLQLMFEATLTVTPRRNLGSP